jgi:hypothetical protein
MWPQPSLNVDSTFPECELYVPCIWPQRSLNVALKLPECDLNFPCIWPQCSLNVDLRRLVLLTLVLGTHVGKSYSASTLVLFLSASCSWDGGSRAQLTLNVDSRFPECGRNVP